MIERHVSLMDAASRLGISYGRALRLVLIGELVGHKSGGHWLVSSTDLDRMESEDENVRVCNLPLVANPHDANTEL